MGVGKFGGGSMADFREYKRSKVSGMSGERGRNMVVRSWWACGEDCGWSMSNQSTVMRRAHIQCYCRTK